MKIIKRQLRRIIREVLLREMTISTTDVEQYLRTQAAQHRQDKSLSGSAIKMLLKNDFMNNVGHQHTLDKRWAALINTLSVDTPTPAGLSQEVESLPLPRKSSWQVRKEKEGYKL